ncbi:NACHT, LRR and PYD domains-containing protein 3-like [Discoglossus pictus]
MSDLLNRTSPVEPLLDELRQKNLVVVEQYNIVRSKSTSQAQMRQLFTYVRAWGDKDKDKFYEALKATNPSVIKDLEQPSEQDALETQLINSLESCRKDYMESITRQYERIRDHNARLGEHYSINKTNLLMIKERRDEEDREHEVISMGRKHLEIMNSRASDEHHPTSIETLFDPGEDGHVPETVVLQGPAGIGKTTTVQKIMFDWASGNLYPDKFSYVFCLSCREINNIPDKMSLSGLLSNICNLRCSENMIKSILGDCKKILVIIDGLDELRWQCQETTGVCMDPFQEVSMEVLVNSLLRKKVLPRASVMITTRPYTLGRLEEVLQSPRYVEVMGFNEENRVEYFYTFFKNKKQAEKAVEIIKDNETLFTMCVVPITCWIVCTVMKQQMERGLNVANTTTSVYWLYVKSLIKYHGGDSDQSVLSCVRKLCALAKDGIMGQKILFDEKDLTDHGLRMSEIESIFLNENIFLRGPDCGTTNSFIHLSVQEWFAALYYVLREDTESGDGSGGHNKEVMDLLRKSESHKHFRLTVHFLFGLCSENQREEIEGDFGCKISIGIKSTLGSWMTERLVLGGDQRILLDYLYETQDEDFTRRMMSLYKELRVDSDNTNYTAISYCLVNSPRRDHYVVLLDVSLNIRSVEILSPGLMKCAEIEFQMCDLTSSWESLRDVITANRSLIRLDLSGNFTLGDSGVKRLCDGLRHPECALQELRLEGCRLTSSCCEDLQDVITTNRSLIKLDLGWNNLGDSGVKLLCDGLRHPDCSLQKMGLGGCRLTSSCWEHLRDVITTNRSLIRLDLSCNELGDSGVKRLCDGLRHPECTLQELRLDRCDLPSSYCEDLRDVITTNRSLITLDLHRNDLGDSGVKRLCDGLRHPKCALQELRLEGCDLTSSCCEDLQDVITTNRSLIRLDLSRNKLGDSGVKRLCDGLRHPDCALRELRRETFCMGNQQITQSRGHYIVLLSFLTSHMTYLSPLSCDLFCFFHLCRLDRCDLTSSCCEDLQDVITTNRSLITLDLSGNKLGDSGVKRLCDGLRHPDCALQELRLDRCDLTSSCCEHLQDVITTNRSLITLDLSSNKLGDSGVKRLCDGLRHPDYALQELRLDGCDLTSSCCEDLQVVITTNRSLIRLDLGWYDLGDSGVKRLCDGLRHPECTLQELE